MSKSNGYGEIEVIEATEEQRAKSELRRLAEADDLEGVKALARRKVAEQKTKEGTDRKSRVLELIEQSTPGEPLDWTGIADAAEIEAAYHRPAPTWRDFRRNAPKEMEYFVDGLIIKNTRCSLTADPKHGKSFLTMYLALCAASGKPFFDREINQCPVMIIDKENAFALNWWRSDAIGRGMGLSPREIDDLPIMPLFRDPTTLTDEASIDWLKTQISDFKPGLVIIDTLIRCTRGLGENSADDMNEVAHVVTELSNDTGRDFVFLFLHHTNRDKEAVGQYRTRGSQDIMAMVDHGFLLEKIREANGNEKFGFSEVLARHGMGTGFEYRLTVNKTDPGHMVLFKELKDDHDNIDAENEINGQSEHTTF